MMFWVLLSFIVNLSALVMLGKWKRNGFCFCTLFIRRVATHTYKYRKHTTLLLSSLNWILCLNSLERVQKYSFLGIYCIAILLIIFDLILCVCVSMCMWCSVGTLALLLHDVFFLFTPAFAMLDGLWAWRDSALSSPHFAIGALDCSHATTSSFTWAWGSQPWSSTCFWQALYLVIFSAPWLGIMKCSKI